MSEALSDPDLEAALAGFEAAVARLNAAGLGRCTDADLVAFTRRREQALRAAVVSDHAVIAQLQTRPIVHDYGAANPAALLRQVLRIPSGEAHARVANAEACGPRVWLTGEVLPPIYSQVAAAQAEGAISARHAAVVVVSAVQSLAPEIQAIHGEALADTIVTLARDLDPDQLARRARHEAYVLDQDGILHEAAYRERTRDFHFRVRPDGSSSVTGELTAEATEHLRTALDVLAKPKLGPDGERDPRSTGQRRHDALLELCKLVARAELLPNAGGITTTVLLTMTREAYATGTGLAHTGHGVTIAAETAKSWIDGETRFIGVLFDSAGRAEAFTTPARLFTENQRLALIARDRGCAFPNCDAPPQRCESHHVIEWVDGGPTSTDNGMLLCRYHHHHFEAMGWRSVMIDGVPHFLPPRWLDPGQAPRRNHVHHPERVLQPV